MLARFIFISALLVQVNVWGQNIYFDCGQSIIRDVIQEDSNKIQAFLDSGTNREALAPKLNNSSTPQLPNIDTGSYWRLTTEANTISLDFASLGTESAYVITGIAIQTVASTECHVESSINAEMYRFVYAVDGREFEITDITGAAVSSNQSQPSVFRTNIDPITAQDLTIHKSIAGAGANCVKYEVFGCPLDHQTAPLLKVPVLEYGLSTEPLQYSNGRYTGICWDGKCTGGVGKLVDGNIGGISDLNLRESGLFTVWRGGNVTITLKLSQYINIGLVNTSYAEIPTNSFDTSGQLTTQSVSLMTITQTINKLVNRIELNINTTASMDIAVSEILIFGSNGENIQKYFQKLYQPQFCPLQTTNSTRNTGHETILIITICVLAVLMLVMGIAIIALICGLIMAQKTKIQALDKMIGDKLHERMMTVAQNRLANYSDVNGEEISTLRKRLRDKMVAEYDMEPPTMKTSHSDTKLFGNNYRKKSGSQTFYMNNTEHANPMFPEYIADLDQGKKHSAD